MTNSSPVLDLIFSLSAGSGWRNYRLEGQSSHMAAIPLRGRESSGGMAGGGLCGWRRGAAPVGNRQA